MIDKRFDYIKQDENKEIEKAIIDADTLDVSTVNLLSGVKYFLKTEQHKLKIHEPSVAAAEVQMKALAAFFNDRRDQLESVKGELTACMDGMGALAAKLLKNGHKAKSVKVSDSAKALEKHVNSINELVEELNESKKEQLEELRKKILKAERVRHFKNLQ